jgi:hypothetical protein
MIRRFALAAFTLLPSPTSAPQPTPACMSPAMMSPAAMSPSARWNAIRPAVSRSSSPTRDMIAVSYSAWGRAYPYSGRLTSLGLQAGVTRDEVLIWRVYAPTSRVDSKALRGNYAGAHAGAAIFVGLGANILVGGSDRTIMLQPVSVEAKTGFNFALAGSAFSLH